NPSTLYFVDSFMMIKSTDAGSTWSDMKVPFEAVSLTIDHFDSSVLYVVAGFPVPKPYKSTDGGNSWARILESQDLQVLGGGLVIHPENSSTLYLGTRQGIIRSDDAGTSWVRTTFPITDASRLVFDPARP